MAKTQKTCQSKLKLKAIFAIFFNVMGAEDTQSTNIASRSSYLVACFIGMINHTFPHNRTYQYILISRKYLL